MTVNNEIATKSQADQYVHESELVNKGKRDVKYLALNGLDLFNYTFTGMPVLGKILRLFNYLYLDAFPISNFNLSEFREAYDIRGVELITKKSVYNHNLENSIAEMGKDLGLKGDITLGKVSDSAMTLETTSHRFSSRHTIGLNPILHINYPFIDFAEDAPCYMPNRNIMDASPMVITEKDPEKRAAIRALHTKEEYGKFLGALGLSNIYLNSVPSDHLIRLASVIMSTITYNQLLQIFDGEVSISTALVFGVTTKLVEMLSSSLFNRYQTYKVDQKAIECTNDLQTAVETLYLLKEIEQSDSFLPKNPLLPTIQDRIDALDPEHKFKLPTLETKELSDVNIRQIETKTMNHPEIQGHIKRRAQLEMLIFSYLPYLAKQSAHILFLGSQLWMLPNALQLITTAFTESAVPLLGVTKNEDEVIQEKAKEIFEEMGVSFPPPTIYLDNANPYRFEAVGIPAVTGQSAVILPSNFDVESEKDLFLFRHEMSHIKYQDSFIIIATSFLTALAVHTLFPMAVDMGDSFSATILTGLAVLIFQSLSDSIAGQFYETRADATAVATAKDPQKIAEGGIKKFDEFQSYNKDVREKHPFGKAIISPEGENRLDWRHPSIKSRKEALAKVANKDK